MSPGGVRKGKPIKSFPDPKVIGIGLRRLCAFVLPFASVRTTFCEKIASSVARLGLRNRRQTDLMTLILCFIDSSSTWLGQTAAKPT
jgi:hypothetical protein